MTKRIATLLAGLLTLPLAVLSQDGVADWYPVSTENKPFVRWWWLGSAVDREGLTYNLEQFAAKGIGGVEITPIYGVQGNETNDIPFLSSEWMEMYRFVREEGQRLGIEVDMNCGTGWPFGGPGITVRYAAKKMELREDGTIAPVLTGQKVKRAAPGGEGLVLDHYDREAVDFYLERFDKAFEESGAPWPDVFFNDSYEVYGADWTGKLPEDLDDMEFESEYLKDQYRGDRKRGLIKWFVEDDKLVVEFRNDATSRHAETKLPPELIPPLE